MPELKVEETASKKEKPKIKIASITIGRCKEGVGLYIKSPVIEEFIKKAYGTRTLPGPAEWNRGEKFYIPESGTAIEITSTRHTLQLNGETDNWLIRNDETLNVSFLRMVGIKEGKTMKFRGLYRESDIAAIAQSINEGLKNLFKEYNTPTCYEIEVTTEE